VGVGQRSARSTVPQRHQQQAGAAAAAGGRARGAVPRALYVCTLYVYVRVYVRAPAAWTGSAGVPRSAYPAPPAGPLRGRLRRGPPGAVPLDLRVPRRLQSAGSTGVGFSLVRVHRIQARIEFTTCFPFTRAGHISANVPGMHWRQLPLSCSPFHHTHVQYDPIDIMFLICMSTPHNLSMPCNLMHISIRKRCCMLTCVFLHVDM
jgi:hypothetical protein